MTYHQPIEIEDFYFPELDLYISVPVYSPEVIAAGSNILDENYENYYN